jgi:MFS family permease
MGLVGFGIFLNRFGGRGAILPLYAADKGLGPGEIGLLFTLGTLAQLLVVVGGGSLSDRFGRKAVMGPSALLAMLGAGAFIVSGQYALLVLAMLVMRAAEGLMNAPSDAFAADLAYQHGRIGTGMALYRTFGDTGTVLGPVLAGVLADLSNYAWALISGDFLLVALIFLLILGAREPLRDRTRLIMRPQ